MGRDGHTMLEKTALLLDAFSDGRALSLADLGARTGLARSTVHRLITDVAVLGWVTRVGQRYELGTALFELGERVPAKHRLRSLALPFMQDPYAVTGETCTLPCATASTPCTSRRSTGTGRCPYPHASAAVLR